MLTITDGWLHGVRQVFSPNYDARPILDDISLVVVHGISLPPGSFGNNYVEQFFTNNLSPALHPYFATIHELKVSAHCFIDRLGAITQFVSFANRAWHAGSSSFQGRNACNDFSIGIELEGEDTVAYSKEQYASLAKVLVSLHKYYPAIANNIVGHSDIAPGRKTDPGPAFDWSLLASLLNI